MAYWAVLSDRVLDGREDSVVGLVGLRYYGYVYLLDVGNDVLVCSDADSLLSEVMLHFCGEFLPLYI